MGARTKTLYETDFAEWSKVYKEAVELAMLETSLHAVFSVECPFRLDQWLSGKTDGIEAARLGFGPPRKPPR